MFDLLTSRIILGKGRGRPENEANGIYCVFVQSVLIYLMYMYVAYQETHCVIIKCGNLILCREGWTYVILHTIAIRRRHIASTYFSLTTRNKMQQLECSLITWPMTQSISSTFPLYPITLHPIPHSHAYSIPVPLIPSFLHMYVCVSMERHPSHNCGGTTKVYLTTSLIPTEKWSMWICGRLGLP